MVFDYSELQMIIKSITNSETEELSMENVQTIISSTFVSSKNCEQIFEIIFERFNSKRSTDSIILKVNTK